MIALVFMTSERLLSQSLSVQHVLLILHSQDKINFRRLPFHVPQDHESSKMSVSSVLVKYPAMLDGIVSFINIGNGYLRRIIRDTLLVL